MHKSPENNLRQDGCSLDFDMSSELEFCETCVGGRHHRSQFQKDTHTGSEEPLGLVHSDECGKLSTKSLGETEYFLTFMDDKTHYVWIYSVKFSSASWNGRLTEKSSGHKLKVLRTDNGGEYIHIQQF